MNKLLIIPIFLFFSIKSFSQDLIVTNEGDSINCKITDVKDGYVYFTFKHKGEIRSTLVEQSQIKTQQHNFFSESAVPSNYIIGKVSYPQWRFAVQGGWSYQTAKIQDNLPSQIESYVKELKKGFHYGAEISYFFSESIGAGLKFQQFRTSNKMDNISLSTSSGTQYGKMEDNIKISFIGPIIQTRLLNSKKKNALILGLGIGYISYRNDFTVIQDYTQTGSTVGLFYDIGYDIGISAKVSLGLNISLMTGLLSKYELKSGTITQTVTLEDDKRIGLGRLDLSVGFRYNL